jgi:hypothetical protein
MFKFLKCLSFKMFKLKCLLSQYHVKIKHPFEAKGFAKGWTVSTFLDIIGIYLQDVFCHWKPQIDR